MTDETPQVNCSPFPEEANARTVLRNRTIRPHKPSARRASLVQESACPAEERRELLNIDLIYGRNIYGENANWITVATIFRFHVGQ